jgi:pimeloyl-ACP methyl ester carboxylesterase
MPLSACGSGDHAAYYDPLPVDAGTDAGTDATRLYPYYADPRPAPADDLVWSRCDLVTENGTATNAAECATFEVPARRHVVSSKRLSLAIKRYRPVQTPRGQLWIVNGGPGASTAALESAIDIFTTVGQDLELYFLDHRGTGNSARLSCETQEASSSSSGSVILGDEWSSCAQTAKTTWGDDLAGFNVTEAATDLGEAIERTRHSDEAVFLYSVSYGTYLAQRYLQLYPNQPTALVLDSICSPGACQLLLNYDRAFDTTVQNILTLCANDANCKTELGTDPYARLRTVADSLGTGHCSALDWSKATLRQIMGFMGMYVGFRDYIPAVIKRVDRCSKNDVAALKVFEGIFSRFDTKDPTFSQPLSVNIALSELSEQPLPSEAEILANVETLYASVDAGPKMAGAVGVWPAYTPDSYYGQFATTTVPMLMLNGTLDPQTPLAVATPTGEHFSGKNQHFIPIPGAAHPTLTQSPIDADYHTCGAELIRQFFDEPTAELDESCLDFVLPINFTGDTDITSVLFGTSTPFADEPPKSTAGYTTDGVRRVEALIQRARLNTPNAR